MKTGIELITAERERQINSEGWTAQHDDSHEAGEMLQAAVFYCAHASDYEMNLGDVTWPWDARFWKPTTPIRNLVKAGALIAAEIDRLQRKSAPITSPFDETKEREEFEKVFSQPPYELNMFRQGSDKAFPGQYSTYAVELAWQAWRAAKKGDAE